MLKKFFQYWDDTSFHLNLWVYYGIFSAAVLFALSFFFPLLFQAALMLLLLIAIAVLLDTFLLYRIKAGINAERILNERFSNGDENKVMLRLQNHYDFSVACEIIDELPVQFQQTNWKRLVILPANSSSTIEYELKPQERGEYGFGMINVYAEGPLKLVRRRFILSEFQQVKVYPSFMQMRRFSFLAVANLQGHTGVKKIRSLGHSLEFEQIKDYVRGDDYRTINWKATARRGGLMANTFTDERSQQVYCIINKGRSMKMPFEGMTLLDYAINASLVLSNIALQKQDKAGLICFEKNVDVFLPADKKTTQINHIMEALYKQQTSFAEPDLEKLFSVVRNRISQRSLLVLFTNFQSLESLQREMPSFRRLAHYHLLMVVFFENTELKQLTESEATSIEDVYIKTIADKFRHEKKLMVKSLQAQGIIAVLTAPQMLTVNALNQYLELKNRQRI